ncbi:MAG: putative Ig domain-containing protein [Ignavibacteria bacterium]
MKIIIITLLCSFMVSISYPQPIPTDSLYFGLPHPGDSSIVFASGKISLPGRNESCITFSPDGKTIFYSIQFWPSSGNPFILCYEYKNNKWNGPDTATFSKNRMTNEPIFAFNGSRLYLDANPTMNQVGMVDLSYVTKNDTVWSNPVSMGSPPNLSADQYHPCIVADTSIYFSTSNGLIARSQYHNGVYQPRTILPFPINYANTTQTWGDPYVAPDESYIILKSTRTGGFGENDIYISYKKSNGNWTNPKNLGNKINTQYDESAGDVTPDGQYMTFSSNKDLKWVSTAFIDMLKHTNFIPYLNTQIPNQTDTIGHVLNYTFPDSTFIDDDGNNTLTYSATLSGGGALPSWINFNPATRTFTFTPTAIGSTGLKVIATDTANASVSCTFNLNVINPVSIRPMNENIINEYKLFQNYPNPFNPSTVICYSLLNNSNVRLKLYDVLGKEITTLVNSFQKRGTYELSLDMNNLSLATGLYFYTITANDLNTNKIFKETKAMSYIK